MTPEEGTTEPMSTETNTAPGPGRISPGRAACEAFWAAVDAGPSIQAPGAAWGWAVSQKATGAWELAAKAATDAGLTAAEHTLAARAVADAERLEAAAAVLNRRYPATRPDELDHIISSLLSLGRTWRRMAAGAEAEAGAQS